MEMSTCLLSFPTVPLCQAPNVTSGASLVHPLALQKNCFHYCGPQSYSRQLCLNLDLLSPWHSGVCGEIFQYQLLVSFQTSIWILSVNASYAAPITSKSCRIQKSLQVWREINKTTSRGLRKFIQKRNPKAPKFHPNIFSTKPFYSHFKHLHRLGQTTVITPI